MLDIKNLVARYGLLTVIGDLSLSVADGTKRRHFRTQRRRQDDVPALPDRRASQRAAGSIAWNGEALPDGNVPETVSKGIAFVPQGHNVFPTLSVEQNLKIAGLPFGSDFLPEIYNLFPVLNERRSQRAGSMSGGEQQMLALGMALMTRPKWLLLDEPSTGLAPVIVRNVMDRLRDVNAPVRHGAHRRRAERAGDAEAR